MVGLKNFVFKVDTVCVRSARVSLSLSCIIHERWVAGRVGWGDQCNSGHGQWYQGEPRLEGVPMWSFNDRGGGTENKTKYM